MSIATSLIANSKRLAHKGAFLVRQKSPELLTAAGVAAVVTSGVLLVRSTIKAVPVIEDMRSDIEDVKSFEPTPDYSERDQQKDLVHVYRKYGLKLAKLYWPAVTTGVAGVVCFVGASHIQRQRNIALLAAYKAIESSYADYRAKVREERGEEEELDLYHNARVVEEKDEETGEVIKRRIAEGGPTVYAKFFDEASPYWNKTPEFNLVFLRAKEKYFTDYLRAKGYVLLNEVYRELGIPETQAGAVVGWSIDAPNSDGYVDFGIYDQDRKYAASQRAFVNGDERSILLDFNVDGPVIGYLKAS